MTDINIKRLLSDMENRRLSDGSEFFFIKKYCIRAHDVTQCQNTDRIGVEQMYEYYGAELC